jgi:hypothetical protein
MLPEGAWRGVQEGRVTAKCLQWIDLLCKTFFPLPMCVVSSCFLLFHPVEDVNIMEAHSIVLMDVVNSSETSNFYDFDTVLPTRLQ